MADECEHFGEASIDASPNTKGCEECEKGKTSMGCNTNVSYMWTCWMLRLFSWSTRDKAFQRNRSSCNGCST